MKINKFKKHPIFAFSFAEMMIVLSLIGFLLVISTKSASQIAINRDLAAFKKAYTGIENTVNFLINDGMIYGSVSGFKDTDAVVVKNIGETIGQNGISKFRDAFKYHMHYVEDKIDCPIYNPNGESANSNICFRTDYGVVFGIPDTDFVKKGIMKINDFDGYEITVVPITFYTNYKDGQNVKDNAFVVTVTYDGKIYFRHTEGVTCSKNSKEMQCKVDKFVKATSVKDNNWDKNEKQKIK